MKNKKNDTCLTVDDLYKDTGTAYKYFLIGLGVFGLHNIYLKENTKFKIKQGGLWLILIAYLSSIIGASCYNIPLDIIHLVCGKALCVYGVFVGILSVFDLITIPYRVDLLNSKLEDAIESNDQEKIANITLYSKKDIGEWVLFSLPLGIYNYMRKEKICFILVMIPLWIISICVGLIMLIGLTSQSDGAEMWLILMFFMISAPALVVLLGLDIVILFHNITSLPSKLFSKDKSDSMFVEVNSDTLNILKEHFKYDHEDSNELKNDTLNFKIILALLIGISIMITIGFILITNKNEKETHNGVNGMESLGGTYAKVSKMINSDGTLKESRVDVTKFDPKDLEKLLEGNHNVANKTFFSKMPVIIQGLDDVGEISEARAFIYGMEDCTIKLTEELLDYVIQKQSSNSKDYYLWGYFVKVLGKPVIYATKLEHIPMDIDYGDHGYHWYRSIPILPYKEIEFDSKYTISNEYFTVEFEKMYLETDNGHLYYNITNNSDENISVGPEYISLGMPDFTEYKYDVYLDYVDDYKSTGRDLIYGSSVAPGETGFGVIQIKNIPKHDKKSESAIFDFDIRKYNEETDEMKRYQIKGNLDLMESKHSFKLIEW